MRSLMVFTKYYLGDQIKKNDMDGGCSTYGGEERERDHLEDPGLDGRRVLKWIFGKWDGGTRTGLIWLRIGRGGLLL
jgi:hypothetical protein